MTLNELFSSISDQINTGKTSKLILKQIIEDLGQFLFENDLSSIIKKKVQSINWFNGRVGLALGDSITNGSTAGAGLFYTDKLAHIIGTGILSKIIRKGFPGERSDQILARYETEVNSEKPDVLFLLIGVNDAHQGVSVEDFAANMTSIVNLARRDGIPLIIGTVPPALTTGNSNERRLLIAKYNMWIKLFCSQQQIRIADIHARLTNIGTGDAVTGWYADLVHPNHYGHQYIAEEFANAFKGLKEFNHLVSSVSVLNAITNPLFLTNANSWYEQPSSTGAPAAYSSKAPSGLLKYGNWWEMDFDATTTGGTKHFCTGINLADKGILPGDKIAITAIMELESIVGNYSFLATNNPPTNAFQLRLMNQSFAPLATIANSVSVSPGPILFTFIVPEDITGVILAMRVTLANGQHAKFRIGEVGVFKVSNILPVNELI